MLIFAYLYLNPPPVEANETDRCRRFKKKIHVSTLLCAGPCWVLCEY